MQQIVADHNLIHFTFIKLTSFLIFFLFTGDGGMIGLTEDERKFCCWKICSPEVARLAMEFENGTVLKENEHSEFHHHEDSPSFQEKFKKHVSGLAMELKQLCNSFIVDESVELFQLDTKDVMGEAVVMTVKTIEEIGQRKYEEFKKARVIDVTQKLEDTITKTSWLFSSSQTQRDNLRNLNQRI